VVVSVAATTNTQLALTATGGGQGGGESHYCPYCKEVVPVRYSIEYLQATDEMVHIAICMKCCNTLATPIRGEMVWLA
jgi:hypothetical protein